jgi:uncharacterized membrane protein YgaE (UPF0421/DUF939 family)
MCKKIIRRFKLLTACEASIGSLLSFLLGAWIAQYLHAGSPLIGGLWAMISAVNIEHVCYREMLKNAKARLLGTLIGVIISFISFSLLGYNYSSFFLSMLISVVLCAGLKLPIYRLCCITVAIMFAVSQVGGYVSPWANCLSRFLESLIGIMIGIALASLLYFLREKFDLKEPA